MGTLNLTECCLDYWETLSNENKKSFSLIHVSTDEVFGDLKPDDKPFSELARFNLNSPYSASKAASDHIIRAWNKTYGLPTITVNCSNNFGPFQFPEKLIPTIIIKALSNLHIPIYGDGKHVRDWLYVDNHVEALFKLSSIPDCQGESQHRRRSLFLAILN